MTYMLYNHHGTMVNSWFRSFRFAGKNIIQSEIYQDEERGTHEP